LDFNAIVLEKRGRSTVSFITELKRRNVFKVAIVYFMLSWLILQVVDVVSGILLFPGWVAQAFLLLLAILLPIILTITWVFELTPQGVKRTGEFDEEASVSGTTGQN
jgi:hypothetical protein